jgi:hypothetical protein
MKVESMKIGILEIFKREPYLVITGLKDHGLRSRVVQSELLPAT